MTLCKLSLLLFGFLLIGSNSKLPSDKEQIINLVKQAYKWHDTDKAENDIVPINDINDSIVIGIDLEKQKLRLDELRKTNLFTEDYINNNYKIAQIIDTKVRNKEFNCEWLVGDIPPFSNNTDPWCNCQDYPYDNPWDKIEITFENLDKENATLTWTWGYSEWSKGFKYLVKVKKINNTWKISYLQGYDLANFI